MSLMTKKTCGFGSTLLGHHRQNLLLRGYQKLEQSHQKLGTKKIRKRRRRTITVLQTGLLWLIKEEVQERLSFTCIS